MILNAIPKLKVFSVAACLTLAAMLPSHAATFDAMIGDDDGFGVGVADNADSLGNSIDFFPFDARSVPRALRSDTVVKSQSEALPQADDKGLILFGGVSSGEQLGSAIP